MLGVVHRLAHGGDVGGHARGGFVMRGENGLDLVILVGLQRLFDQLGIIAGAPLALLHDDIETLALAEIDPQMRELAEALGENLVAGRQRVGDRSFPAAGAGRREDEGVAVLGAEHLLEAGNSGFTRSGKVGER